MPLNITYTLGPTSTITLGQLRELVEATADWNATTGVEIKHMDGGQRERSQDTITVRKQ